MITGTQINGTYLTDAQATENHYLSPGMSYCVVNGEKTDLNLDI